MTDVRLHSIDDDECLRFQGTIEVVGRRWSSGIMLALVRGAERFSEIRAAVIGLSDRMLAQRLRELEASGLVVRTVLPTQPVQVRYALTAKGASLMRSLTPLVAWGHEWDEPTRATEAG